MVLCNGDRGLLTKHYRPYSVLPTGVEPAACCRRRHGATRSPAIGFNLARRVLFAEGCRDARFVLI